jgi:hypothetical protein
VVASSAGLHAAFERATIAPDAVAPVPDLILELGSVTIRGRLLLPPGAKLSGCRVAARRADIERDADGWHWPELEWRDGRFSLSLTSAHTDREGAFVLGGLEPGPYVLTLEDVPGVDLILDADPLPVVAPAAGILLTPDLAHLTVTVTVEGQAAAGAAVRLIDANGASELRTGGDGIAAVLIGAPIAYTIEADCLDATPRAVELPAAGRPLDPAVVLELPAQTVELARLVLEPRLDGERALPRVKVTLDSEGAEREERSLEVADGRFVLEELRPGRWNVLLEPDEGSIGPYYESWYRTEPFAVELVAGETARRVVDFTSGGRLRIVVKGHTGIDEHGNCTILDAAGRELPVRYVTRSYEDNIISIGSSTGATALDQPADVYPNLLPGTYLIQLDAEGYAPVERTVRVRAGEVTEVELRVHAF